MSAAGKYKRYVDMMCYIVDMAYIRKVKTGSGATAVQIVRKECGELIIMEHVGSVHSDEALARLIEKARKKLAGKQRMLFDIDEMNELLER